MNIKKPTFGTCLQVIGLICLLFSLGYWPTLGIIIYVWGIGEHQ